jgi:hypothetical protein
VVTTLFESGGGGGSAVGSTDDEIEVKTSLEDSKDAVTPER